MSCCAYPPPSSMIAAVWPVPSASAGKSYTVASEDGVADPWLFRGGFLVTAAATLAMIAAVTHRYTITSRVLAMRPLLWVGTRSYGLYLFHWPIYQMIRGIAGKPLSWQQFLLAMAITVPITELSYHFLEMPIRKRQFAAWWDGLRRRRNPADRKSCASAWRTRQVRKKFEQVHQLISMNITNNAWSARIGPRSDAALGRCSGDRLW